MGKTKRGQWRAPAVALCALLLLPGRSRAQVKGGALATFGTTVVVPFGLRGEVYNLRRNSSKLPRFEKRKPVGAIYTPSLNITPRDFNEGFPGVTSRFEWFAIDYQGRFWIEKPGEYRFSLLSDDGSKLYIDDEVVIDNDRLHPPKAEYGRVVLGGGIHGIRVSYFQGPRFHVALVLSVAGPGEDWRIFSTDEFKPPVNPEDWKYGDPGQLQDPAKAPDRPRSRTR